MGRIYHKTYLNANYTTNRVKFCTFVFSCLIIDILTLVLRNLKMCVIAIKKIVHC
jgi:hypothetical protein